MAVIRAFKAVRPKAEFVDKVAALPYDVMSSDEAREMVKDNPYSFLHVDKAEIDLEPTVDLYDSQVYQKARANLNQMVEDGIFIEEKEPYLYIYRQKMGERYQTGIVGCTSIDDYMNNVIKKHELTRADKEQDRIKHVDYCDANTGPILLTYRHHRDIDQLVADWIENNQPCYDFISEDNITHTIWVINDFKIIEQLIGWFGKIESLYIADGHHRSASAVKVGQMRREKNPDYKGDEEFNYFLSIIFPDNQLKIMDYNRVVKDLNRMDSQEFLQKIQFKFEVEPAAGTNPVRPESPATFGMYLERNWYLLKSKEGTYDNHDPVQSLDASILQDNLLGPLLDINDPRTDKRIDFVGGIRGLKELEKRVNEGMKAAFSLYPTSIEQLMNVADAGQLMPPKSTWFEPKLRSGIFIHKLK